MIDEAVVRAGKIEIGGEVYDHLGTLKDDAFARTELVAKDGNKYLYKISRLRLGGLPKMHWLMKRLTAREVRIHGLLAGVRGVPKLVKGFEDISKLPNLIKGLRGRGWTETELDKLLGANWLRVYERVWGG